ncbi:MAG: hypothetical protein JXR83_21300 [Deltaproteobacteria bacterium]|nr:hypothetical protein [Deltaproteobacteria bacterium]
MKIDLTPRVVGDGSVALDWRADRAAQRWTLLIVRTGSVPGYTALHLSADSARYQINNLSRHQRYLFAVLGHIAGGRACSAWWSVTPRTGLEPIVDTSVALEQHLARLERFTVMPQDRRLTAYWQLSPGFVDQLVLEVQRGERIYRRFELEPEVNSLSLDHGRGLALKNGEPYRLLLGCGFAGTVAASSAPVTCTAAPQGEERAANQAFDQQHLIYPFLALGPEVQIFEDDGAPAPAAVGEDHRIICCHCRQPVEWDAYRLRCKKCGAEFIPNGRGAFLDVARLRFGTCQCCLPKKIIIQKPHSEELRCAHSGKEHIRLPDAAGFLLIEDLPFGLCQCCRPRRPLTRQGKHIVCSRSGEQHRNEHGRYVLVPTQPVFDAAAIDDLLDAGLAEICASGVSRARR